MNSSILVGITVLKSSVFFKSTRQTSDAPINAGIFSLGCWPTKVTFESCRSRTIASVMRSLSAPSPTRRKRYLGLCAVVSGGLDKCVESVRHAHGSDVSRPQIFLQAESLFKVSAPRLRRAKTRTFYAVFHNGDFFARQFQCLIECSLNAGVTTTTRLPCDRGNQRSVASMRCRNEFSAPIPTALRDSGQRSRTSKTKGTRFQKEIHHPESPTRSCGDVAMTTSGRETPFRAMRLRRRTNRSSACAHTPCDSAEEQPRAHHADAFDIFPINEVARPRPPFLWDNPSGMIRKPREHGDIVSGASPVASEFHGARRGRTHFRREVLGDVENLHSLSSSSTA